MTDPVKVLIDAQDEFIKIRESQIETYKEIIVIKNKEIELHIEYRDHILHMFEDYLCDRLTDKDKLLKYVQTELYGNLE